MTSSLVDEPVPAGLVRVRPTAVPPEELRIDPEFQSLCPALLPTERDGLEAALRVEGCRDSLVVWHEPNDGRWLVVDGHNRFDLCTKHSVPFSTVELLLADRDEVRLWIMENQFGRRNLTDGARALLAVEYKKTQEVIARKRMQEAGKFGVLGGRPKTSAPGENPCDNVDTGVSAPAETADGAPDGAPEPEASPVARPADAPVGLPVAQPAKRRGQKAPPSDKPPAKPPKGGSRAPTARALAAKQAKVSEGTVTKTEYILEHADKPTIIKLAAGQTNVNREYKRLRDDEKKAKREEIARKARENPPPAPTGPFAVVLADPPWKYEHEASSNREIENQYTTMDVAEICDLMLGDKSVRSIIADDAVLYLWATSPKLVEALKVMAAWSFEYKTCLVWIKRSPEGKLQSGMGYWARQCHELLLVGTRGKIKPPPTEARVNSVIEAPRGKHSEKPEAAHQLIEQAFEARPECQKIELFARAPRAGWAVWGNEPAVTEKGDKTS